MEKHVHALLRQMRDSDADMRRQSILALKDADITAERVEVITALIDALDDSHIAVREAAEATLIAIGGADVVAALIPCLSHESPTVLNYAIEILSRIGLDAVQYILPLLESRDHDIRKFACDILGKLKYADAMYELIDLLKDPHVNVAISAGEALGNIGSPEAVPYLIRSLHHADTWMKCIAVEALGKIGDARAVEPFINFPVSEDPIVLYTVIKAMGNFDDERVLPYILAILHSNPMFASSAAQAIDQLADRHGERVYQEVSAAGVGEAFIRLLSNDNLDVVRSAISLVGHLRLTSAVPSLRSLLEHHDAKIIAKSASALVRIGDPGAQALSQVFVRLLPSFQRDVAEYDEQLSLARLPLLRMLGESRSEYALDGLVQALDERIADEIRAEAAIAIGKILGGLPDIAATLQRDDDRGRLCLRAIQHLAAEVSDSCDACRMNAAEALGDTGTPMAYDALLRLVQDESLAVSEAASAALIKLRGISPEAKFVPLRNLLNDLPDKALPDTARASVLRTMYRIAGEQEIAFYMRFLTDSSPAVRVAALEALRTCSISSACDEQIPLAVARALHDEDVQVRIAAIQSFVFWANLHRDPGTRVLPEQIVSTLRDSLMPLLNDPHQRVQYVTCQHIADLIPSLPGHPEVGTAVVESLIHLLADEDTMVKIAAIEALTAISPYVPAARQATPMLLALSEQATDEELRASLQHAIDIL
ncbi:hypothetical protein U14_03747 [Candidatus Moduliflexus flocculans]|uniref:Uncharacterized protein n=1 Tax=Candidatus Moduliflexus flocculans TaxID=1499966 RepID=A0A081BQ30_9BACT|nr:hypothetical protein U14_03747 [Candidatus Moduliflexus flocculans]